MSDAPVTAKVAVAAAAYWLDRPYDYLIPESLVSNVVPGVRVVVPFGRGNRRTEGIVLSLGTHEDRDIRLKTIASVLDKEPVLSGEMLRLAVWIRERYFCTVYDAVHTMLPAGLWYSMESAYSLSPGTDKETAYKAAGSSRQEQLILDALFAHGGSCPVSDLRRLFDGEEPARALQSLVRKKILETDSREKRRVGDKRVRMASLNIPVQEAGELAEKKEKRAPLQAAVLRLLCTLERVSYSEIRYFTGASAATVNALVKSGLVICTEEDVFRRPGYRSGQRESLPVLNEEQSKAFESILRLYEGAAPSASLLYGVTGSGKTSVYVHLINQMLQMGKSAILMVPEIALTPQMLTEGLTVEECADRIVVAHPFNPVHMVPYVELCQNEWTKEGVVGQVVSLLEDLGRKPVVLKKATPGFIGNRLQFALFREAMALVEQGVCDYRDIDTALNYSFCPRYTSIGIFEHFDAAGLDLDARNCALLFPKLSNATQTPQIILDKLRKQAEKYPVEEFRGTSRKYNR